MLALLGCWELLHEQSRFLLSGHSSATVTLSYLKTPQKTHGWDVWHQIRCFQETLATISWVPVGWEDRRWVEGAEADPKSKITVYR